MINIEPELFLPKGIEHIEHKYSAKYVCETCIGYPANKPGMWNWINWPVAVFYHRNVSLVPEGGSQYLGLYCRRRIPEEPLIPYVCNAISTTFEPFTGIMADDGEVIYSHYRHDYRYSKDGSVWIDGGRDYVRYDGKSTLVELQIKEGVLCIV